MLINWHANNRAADSSNGSHRRPDSPQRSCKHIFRKKHQLVTQDLRLIKPSIEFSIIIQQNHYYNHAISIQLHMNLSPWLFFLRLLETNQTIFFQNETTAAKIPSPSTEVSQELTSCNMMNHSLPTFAGLGCCWWTSLQA